MKAAGVQSIEVRNENQSLQARARRFPVPIRIGIRRFPHGDADGRRAAPCTEKPPAGGHPDGRFFILPSSEADQYQAVRSMPW